MILRRVIAHFREQEWTAIGLDFLIVVVGVFVGLQVNNWNEARADARREVFYLTSLRQDFDFIIAELEGDAARYEEIAKSMSLLLEQSRTQSPDASLAELHAAASQLILMEGTPIVSDTYLNLTGSGDLAIIKSQTIKNSLAAFNGQADIVRLIGDTHEMQLVNLFQPYVIENLDYTGMLRVRGRAGLTPPAAFESGGLLAAMQTAEFRNVVAVKWDAVTDIRNYLLKARDSAQNVKTLLNAELENRR
jgi:hypothetical protein